MILHFKDWISYFFVGIKEQPCILSTSSQIGFNHSSPAHPPSRMLSTATNLTLNNNMIRSIQLTWPLAPDFSVSFGTSDGQYFSEFSKDGNDECHNLLFVINTKGGIKIREAFTQPQSEGTVFIAISARFSKDDVECIDKRVKIEPSGWCCIEWRLKTQFSIKPAQGSRQRSSIQGRNAGDLVLSKLKARFPDIKMIRLRVKKENEKIGGIWNIEAANTILKANFMNKPQNELEQSLRIAIDAEIDDRKLEDDHNRTEPTVNYSRGSDTPVSLITTVSSCPFLPRYTTTPTTPGETRFLGLTLTQAGVHVDSVTSVSNYVLTSALEREASLKKDLEEVKEARIKAIEEQNDALQRLVKAQAKTVEVLTREETVTKALTEATGELAEVKASIRELGVFQRVITEAEVEER